jgi:orotidine-5'-phosphate decarboxylase
MGGKVLTLPYMTHVGAQLFFGHPLNIEHVVNVFEKTDIKLAENKVKKCKTISDAILILGDYLGVDGFIGPANNPEVLKRYRQFTGKDIFAPGIGRQSVGKLTPKEQLKKFFEICGEKSAAIVGSAIYKSPDPAKAANEFSKLRDEAVL